MSDSFGLKLGIEGEKEFKQALKDINSTFKVLGSELTLVSSQFDKESWVYCCNYDRYDFNK